VKVLNIFADESGVYGPYEKHSPYYIVTLVFHDQSTDVSKDIEKFLNKMTELDLTGNVVHSGRLIRREFEYKDISLIDRKRIFNAIYNFSRVVDIKYHSFMVEKKHIVDDVDLSFRLIKQLSSFLQKNLETFVDYDNVIVYYDYGQNELTKLLISSFNMALNSVEVKKTKHSEYQLFQVADMLCTLELISAKAERNQLSKSETVFFKSKKNLYKSYLRAIQSKKN
jgi:hypothetical protein